jgi:hypothetical protein
MRCQQFRSSFLWPIVFITTLTACCSKAPVAPSGKSVHGELTVRIIGSVAELKSVKQDTPLRYLGRDKDHYYVYGYGPMKDDRVHVLIYSVTRNIIDGDKLREILESRSDQQPLEQPPVVVELLDWIKEHKIVRGEER